MSPSDFPSRAAGAKPSASPYENPILVRLWREWLSAADIPLDKWMKQTLRNLSSPKSGGRSAGAHNSLGLDEQAAIARAMNDAVRFQQLACALEHAYQLFAPSGKLPEVDWLAWDHAWQPRDLQAVPPSRLWLWVQLRVTGDSARRNSHLVADSRERNEFFHHLVAEKYFSTLASGLLWFGVRPQWHSLIHQRQQLSGWTDEQLTQFLHAQVQLPPLWLRVQHTAPVAEVCAALNAQGVQAGVDPQGFLFATGGRGVNTTREYQSGAIEIQDLASQLIARAVASTPGQKIWDACAGAGGKSLAIAAQLGKKGAVFATDLHGYKLDELKRRAKRASIFNIRTFTWSGDEPLKLPKEVAQQQGFDWVLVDAPCSSSGTWRRNPDARWRFDESDTRELVQLQQKILTHAAPGVRGGGHLVYATCSWQASENEQQVQWFLQQHPHFILQSQQLLGAPELDSDTMFVAVLQRQG